MNRTGFRKYSFQEAKARLTQFGRARQPLKRGKRLGAGRKTRESNAARRHLKRESARLGITTCELRGRVDHVCSYDDFLGYAHDAKRRKLSKEDLKRAILVCNSGHDAIEFLPPAEMKRIVNDTIAARKAA